MERLSPLLRLMKAQRRHRPPELASWPPDARASLDFCVYLLNVMILANYRTLRALYCPASRGLACDASVQQ
jgi:hypothetical protein